MNAVPMSAEARRWALRLTRLLWALAAASLVGLLISRPLRQPADGLVFLFLILLAALFTWNVTDWLRRVVRGGVTRTHIRRVTAWLWLLQIGALLTALGEVFAALPFTTFTSSGMQRLSFGLGGVLSLVFAMLLPDVRVWVWRQGEARSGSDSAGTAAALPALVRSFPVWIRLMQALPVLSNAAWGASPLVVGRPPSAANVLLTLSGAAVNILTLEALLRFAQAGARDGASPLTEPGASAVTPAIH